MQRSKDFIDCVKAIKLEKPWRIEEIDSYIASYTINKARYVVYTLETNGYLYRLGRYIFAAHTTKPLDVRYSPENTRQDWLYAQFMLFPQHDDKDFNLIWPTNKRKNRKSKAEDEQYDTP